MSRPHRSLALPLAALLILSVALLGCSAAPAQTTGKPAGEPAKPAPAQKIVIRLGDVINEQDPQFKAMEHFAKRMAELTNGQVEVRLFPNSQLGDQRTMLEAAQQGNQEMVKTSNAVMSGFTPRIQILDLPYIMRDSDHAKKVFASSQIQKIVGEDFTKAGFKLYTFFDPRARSVYNGKRPIIKPEDMKGLKIRVMQSPVMIDTVNAMGGSGVPMAFGELYSALQQGVVDGAENAPNFFYTQKHYEVTKYFSLTEQFRSPEEIVMNAKWYDALPQNVKDAMAKVAPEMYDLEMKERAKLDADVMTEMENKGVKVNKVDQEPFRQLMKSVYDKHAATVGGREVIDAVLNVK